ncbi:MAG: hypothetical protein ACKOI2_14655, partial [Actinomycetota bacterium]
MSNVRGIVPIVVGLGMMSSLLACGDETSNEISMSVSADEVCPTREPVEGRALRIATTVAPITSIAANIASGTATEIQGIVPEGTNSHTYEP